MSHWLEPSLTATLTVTIVMICSFLINGIHLCVPNKFTYPLFNNSVRFASVKFLPALFSSLTAAQVFQVLYHLSAKNALKMEKTLLKPRLEIVKIASVEEARNEG